MEMFLIGCGFMAGAVVMAGVLAYLEGHLK